MFKLTFVELNSGCTCTGQVIIELEGIMSLLKCLTVALEESKVVGFSPCITL